MVYVLRKIHVGVTTSPNSHQGDMGSFYYHLLDLMLMEQLQDECMLVYVMVPCLPTYFSEFCRKQWSNFCLRWNQKALDNSSCQIIGRDKRRRIWNYLDSDRISDCNILCSFNFTVSNQMPIIEKLKTKLNCSK